MDPNVLRLAIGSAGGEDAKYKLFEWGRNDLGQLGIGNTTNYSSPKQVGSLTTWVHAANGPRAGIREATIAIKTDGTMWSWGSNYFGQLGLNIATNETRSSPVQIGSGTDWATVALNRHALAVKTDGTLWAWGRNASGQLGTGNSSQQSSPVQVGSLTNWAGVSCGNDHSIAIKTNGTIWAWGKNEFGQLGINLGYQYIRNSPTQIGSGTDWASVSAGDYSTFAIKTNGTLWAWGRNDSGELGLGNTTNYSSPKQVGSLTSWSKVAGGANHALALRTNGSLFSWGINGSGQLGLNNTTSYSSPMQVGNLQNWSKIAGGSSFSLAIKTDGTLWSWGINSYGRLGIGDTTNRSSPIQVGSATNWWLASGAITSSLGITKDP